MSSRIAYFINQYPKVSHTFIRREILALEHLGIEVDRLAIRGWDAEIADEVDREEQAKTTYLLRSGIGPLFASAAVLLLKRPVRWLSALGLAARIGLRQGRLAYRLVYFLEACHAARWLGTHGTTHIHAHFGTNSAEVAMLASSLGGIPFSFTVHGPEEFDDPASLGLRRKVRRSAFVVAVSSYGRSQLLRWIEPKDSSKVHVVHCGIDREFLETDACPIPETPRLVCVGRLCAQKAQLLLLEAAKKLALKGVPFELVLAGDGELRPAITSFIQKHGLERRVRVTGWIDSAEVRRQILSSRALVLPSLAEGLPIVIMEAMALRRPVLSTWVAGIPELVQHGSTGWLVPPGDIEELVTGMERVLTTPTEELQAMGDAGYARVMGRHAGDAAAAQLMELFAEALGERSSRALDRASLENRGET